MQRLFYCVTPLNLLVVGAIRRLVPGDDTIIYIPTSDSSKHKSYFDQSTVVRKIFISLPPFRSPDILVQHALASEVSAKLKGMCFDQIFYACLGSIPFSRVATTFFDAEISTYDDGILHIDQATMLGWLNNEPLSHKVYRKLFRLQTTPLLLKRTTTHYTIFPPALISASHKAIVQVPFYSEIPSGNDDSSRNIDVLLGTPEPQTILGITQAAYNRLLRQLPFHVYIPHPRETRPAYVSDALPEPQTIRDLISRCIAEDIAFELRKMGFMPRFTGFWSTALITLASRFEAINYYTSFRSPPAIFNTFGVKASCIDDYLRGPEAVRDETN